MTTRLPPVLSYRDLPSAELQCAALDGELFALDLCYCPIDEFDTTHLRARALGAVIDKRIIAEQMTAAWIWSAVAFPPMRHQLCVAIGARTRPGPELNAILREVVIANDDVSTVSGLKVTTRPRTIIDLLRFDEEFTDRVSTAVIHLMTDGMITAESLECMLISRRNLPNKRLALSRLNEVRERMTHH